MSGSLISRSRAMMLATAGAMALSMVSAGGAQAAPAAERCTIKSFTPANFIVASVDTEREFKVKTSGCTQKNWKIDLLVEDTTVLLAKKSLPLTTFVPQELDNNLAGSYPVEITVTSTDNEVTKKKFIFSLQRRSTFGKTFNIGPEPATRGGTLKVLGNLQRVSWGENPAYEAYAGRNVQVQFKAVGTKTFKLIKSVKTDGEGNIATTVRARKSGTWRLRFAGNAATGAATSVVDPVRVRAS